MDSNVLISAKAFGLLFFIITRDAHISAESLSRLLKEGEAAIGTGLRELRAAKLIATENKRSYDGYFSKETKVTDEGYEYFAKSLANVGPFNSHFTNIYYKGEVQGGKSIGKFLPNKNNHTYSVLNSDGFSAPSTQELIELERLETLEEQQRELKRLTLEREAWEAKEKKKQARGFKARSAKPDKSTWSHTDVSFEFADRLEQYWNIPPWTVSKTRFRMILADNRRRFSTDGFKECAMMDLFFEWNEVEKFTSAEHVMLKFFRDFGELKHNCEIRGKFQNQLEHEKRDYAEKRLKEKALARLRGTAEPSSISPNSSISDVLGNNKEWVKRNIKD